MDLKTLNEVADRKRMKIDVQHLKEKISRENSKIIKLKVAQDGSFWDLKEKYTGLARDHETLQQNMVKLQMDYESVSAQYQDELRRRPETLNKLESTREICDVLNESVSRVRASLQRSAADRAQLAETYARAGAAVAAVKADTEKRLLAATNEARHARDIARLSSEHGAQLMECVARERARAEQAIASAERMRDQRDTAAEHLARRDTLLQEREKSIQEMRNEMRRVAAEFNEQNERAKNAIGELQKEAGASVALRAALSQAEARVEAASRDLSRLTGELQATTTAKNEALQHISTLQQKIEENHSNMDKMKEGMELLIRAGENLEKQAKEKDQKIRSLEQTTVELQQTTQTLEERNSLTIEERARERRDFEERITEYERDVHGYKEQVASIEQELLTRANTIQNLTSDIEELKETMARENDNVVEQINKLERDRCDVDKRILVAENKITEYTSTIERLKDELSIKTDECVKVNATLAEVTTKNADEHRTWEERNTIMLRELEMRVDTINKLNREISEIKEEKSRIETAIAEQTSLLERERGDKEKCAEFTERERSENTDTISRLKNEIALATSANTKANATIAELTAKYERECREYEEKLATAERELAEQSNTIASLQRNLSVETEARSRADIVLEELRSELEHDRHDFEDRSAAAERDLTERNNTIEKLRRELANETKARADADATLVSTRDDLLTTRAEATIALNDVRHLKTEIRGKEEELAKQMQTILSLRADKEKMQMKIDEMQETIKNIQRITSAPPPHAAGTMVTAHRDPPEHDDNALPAPPEHFPKLQAAGREATPAPRRDAQSLDPKITDMIYHIFSEDSAEGLDLFELGETKSREYEARSRLFSPARPQSKGLKRPHAAAKSKREMAPAQPPMGTPPDSIPAPKQRPVRPGSPPTVETEPADQLQATNAPRKFFKSRRADRRHKK